MLKFIAIDPGNNGAVVFFTYEESDRVFDFVEAIDMPTVKIQVRKGNKIRSEPDFDQLCIIAEKIKSFGADDIFLEQQWARAGDSAMTGFTLGGWYYLLRLALHEDSRSLHNGYELISPTGWKRWKPYAKYGLWGAGDDAKEIAIEMFSDIFPDHYENYFLQPLYKNSKNRRCKPRDGRADASLLGLHAACLFHDLQPPQALQLSSRYVSTDNKCTLF